MSRQKKKPLQPGETESTEVEALEGDGAVDGAPVAAADLEAAADASDEVATPLLSEVETLKVERDELQDKMLRLAAEFDNHRKRTAREWQGYRRKATGEVLMEMLELLDNFERALQSKEEDTAGLIKGVELIHQQFLMSLKKFGLTRVEAKGQPFDPARHEAILMVDSSEVESQHVVDVVQPGYTIDDEVFRPARVTVSRGATNGSSDGESCDAVSKSAEEEDNGNDNDVKNDKTEKNG